MFTRVCTANVAEVAPASRIADCGGVTMSWLPAVPPVLRSTTTGLLGAVDALTTKVAGCPCGTLSSTDWMVRTGTGVAAAVSLAT